MKTVWNWNNEASAKISFFLTLKFNLATFLCRKINFKALTPIYLPQLFIHIHIHTYRNIHLIYFNVHLIHFHKCVLLLAIPMFRMKTEKRYFLNFSYSNAWKTFDAHIFVAFSDGRNKWRNIWRRGKLLKNLLLDLWKAFCDL